MSLEIALEEWGAAILHITDQSIKKALEYCRSNLKWPPCIAEFLEICERDSGIPSLSEIIQLAINRDFSHPLTLKIFNEVGSWAFSHDSEKELTKKVKQVYDNSLSELRTNPDFLKLGKGD